MAAVETVLGLLVIVLALGALANRIGVAYPILLVLGGLGLGFLPFLPDITLDPDLVLLVFLPPLLYWQSLTGSVRDLKTNLRTILFLAIGLVLMTVGVVGVVGHDALALPWAAAFTLGAIIAPTDEVAAVAIASKMSLSRRTLAIIEGESLVNDAAALVAYGVAVAAVTTGTFAFDGAVLRFVVSSLGGVLIGLGVGVAVLWLRKRLVDGALQNTLSILTPLAAYVPAVALDVSGVLAVVAVGLYLSREGPRVVSAGVRLQGFGFWDLLVFPVNGLLFILVGLQLHQIVAALTAYTATTLALDALIVSATVIVLRLLWMVFVGALLHLGERLRGRDWRILSVREQLVIGWTGMRGGVSLAAALAIPAKIASGKPFPDRDLILFLTFSVILATLVVQGLTLPKAIDILGVKDDGSVDREERDTRLTMKQAALDKIDALAHDHDAPSDDVERLRDEYKRQLARLKAGSLREDEEGDDEAARHLRRALLDEERRAVVALRDRGEIGDDVLLRIQRELDLEDVHLSEIDRVQEADATG